jgi:hypothetical protein
MDDKRVNIVVPICFIESFLGPKGIDDERNVISLHGGIRPSNRILGLAGAPTPVHDFMQVVHGDQNTYVIYTDDEHEDNPNDPAIEAHFSIFGRHAVVGTQGAEPVGSLGEFHDLRRSQRITTDVLNLATHPPVVEAITSIIDENEITNPSQVRFLVLGGLTDVLVADLAKGLNHICGIPNPTRKEGERWDFFGNVGVAANYCFSNLPSDHDAALRSMGKVAINIFRTNEEAFNFLGIDA